MGRGGFRGRGGSRGRGGGRGRGGRGRGRGRGRDSSRGGRDDGRRRRDFEGEAAETDTRETAPEAQRLFAKSSAADAAEKRGPSAYAMLLGGLQRQNQHARRGAADDDEDDDGSDGDAYEEDDDEDEEVVVEKLSRGAKKQQAAAGAKRARPATSHPDEASSGEDDDDDASGSDADDNDDSEEDGSDVEDGSDAADEDDEQQDGGGGSEDEDEDGDGSSSGAEGGDAGSTGGSSSGAGSAARAAAQRRPQRASDPYLARFHSEALDDAAAGAAAHAATLAYAPVPGFALACEAAGAGGLDSMTGHLVMSASSASGSGGAAAGAEAGDAAQPSASASASSALAAAAAHVAALCGPGSRLLVAGSSAAATAAAAGGAAAGGLDETVARLPCAQPGAILLPPAADLARDFAVSPRLAAAWEATYGAEPRALAAARLRAEAEAAAAAGDDAGAAAGAEAHARRPFTPLQWALWGPLAQYRDIYFAARTHVNARELRTLSALHAANHALKARAIVARDDGRIRAALAARRAAQLEAGVAKATAAAAAAEEGSGGAAGSSAAAAGAGGGKKGKKGAAAAAAGAAAEQPQPQLPEVPECRDQGFTRPTVLVLLPTRHAALRWVRSLLRLLGAAASGAAAKKARKHAAAAAAAAAAGGGDGSGAEDDNDDDAADTAAAAGGATRFTVLNRNRFFREFCDPDDEGSGGLISASSLGADYEDDEEELERNAGTPAALAALALRQRQLISDDEGESGSSSDEDDGDGSDDGEGGDGSGAGPRSGSSSRRRGRGRYPFNTERQGWPKGLRERLRAEKRAALLAAEGGDDGAAEGDDEADAAAAAAQGGKKGKKAKKGEESILGSYFERQAAEEKAKRKAEKEARRRARLAAAAAAAGGGGGPQKAHRMPADYRAAFAGNIDDDFRVGIALQGAHGSTVKLFADFYHADIIVASPLGLRRILGGEGDRKALRDTDFLSSVEVCILDGAEAMLQQNWAHVTDAFALLNALPSSPRNTDFARVREWALAGLGRHFRQTVVFSAWVDPDVSRLLRKQCANTRGGVLLRGARYAGTLTRVAVPARQLFVRVQPVASLGAADDARFAHFANRLLPDILASVSLGGSGAWAHTLIYAPSYFDYVRLRNLLDAKEAEFITCSEYSEDKDVARARSRFYTGSSPLLLLTERFHYFRRLRVRGIRHLIFYGPPNVPHFYSEFVNLVVGGGGGGRGVKGGAPAAAAPGAGGPAGAATAGAAAAADATSVTLLFTRYDVPALERIVGTARVAKMAAEGPKTTFVFV